MANTKNPLTISDIPTDERPRERLLSQGAKYVSNTELLAIILRTGTIGENALRLAERILAEHGGLAGLIHISQAELEQITGLGPAKVSQILATLELARRLATLPIPDQPVIHSAADAARLVMDMGYLQQEHFRVILLDAARRVTSIPTVYIGTLNATVLRVAEVFREAIVRNAPSLILAHNHPSGDPSPSPEDIEITRTIVQAGGLLDIIVIDHLIVSPNDWRSLRNLGIVFG
jgi:DNA repair protein RadC